MSESALKTDKPHIDAEAVASWSKTYRAVENLTQRALAAIVKTTPGVIGELERGKVRSRRVAREIMELSVADASEVI